jgi:hypothetical protein
MKYLRYVTYLFLTACNSPEQHSYIIDTDRDTSFVVEKKSDNPTIRVSVEGYLTHNADIVVKYYESKVDTNHTFDIPLFAGDINLKEFPWDFYADKARIVFKHGDNKKGKLKVKVIL